MTQKIPPSQSGSGIIVDLGETDDCLVNADVTLVSTTATTIVGTGSNQTVEVHGIVRGNSGIQLGNNLDLDSGMTVDLAASSRIFATNIGVCFFGNEASLTNDGLIASDNVGALFSGFHEATESTFENSGSVFGKYGIYSEGSAETIVLENTGAINGSLYSYYATNFVKSSGTDIIRNHGTMVGDIQFHTGDDIYDGHDGTMQGKIHGDDGNDTIIGGNGSEEIFGDSGSDRLIGLGGRDFLTGGGDSDRFVLRKAGDSTVAMSGRDEVLDFSTGGDFFDVHLIDANEDKGKNQKFDFIGGSKFHREAGELRFFIHSGETTVAGDTDGDGKADFAVDFDGEIRFKASDFIL
jgi:Ca2+-binding RTX toxin-like protein